MDQSSRGVIYLIFFLLFSSHVCAVPILGLFELAGLAAKVLSSSSLWWAVAVGTGLFQVLLVSLFPLVSLGLQSFSKRRKSTRPMLPTIL